MIQLFLCFIADLWTSVDFSTSVSKHDIIDFNFFANLWLRSDFDQFSTGLTLHNEAAPTEELAAFGGNLNHSMERKKVYTKPVPKDFAKAWEKNDGEQESGGWGGQGQEWVFLRHFES